MPCLIVQPFPIAHDDDGLNTMNLSDKANGTYFYLFLAHKFIIIVIHRHIISMYVHTLEFHNVISDSPVSIAIAQAVKRKTIYFSWTDCAKKD